MLIADVLAQPGASRRYMERYVNDGSPSGFSWKYNTSAETNPIGDNSSFQLYSAAFQEKLVTDYGEIPIPLDDGSVLIHPDMLGLGLIRSHCESISVWPFEVSPTSSSRTVEILYPGPPGYVKLNYKGMIGRTDRQLTRNHAISAIELTEMIRAAIGMNRLPRGFSFLAEPGARVVSLPDGPGEGYEWGMVFREVEPFPYSHKFAFAIPSFSLFSRDVKRPTDPVLLNQLIDHQNAAPDEYLFEGILSPLVSCYFTLIVSCALQLECHAQNALVGFDSEMQPKGIIFRDLESVDKDISLAEDLHLDVHFRSAPYKCLQREQYNYTIMHSFMYDFKLGEYFITPLIDVISRSYGIDPASVAGEIRALARRFIDLLPETFFPSDGMWYDYDNIVHDRGKPRPYRAKPNPKYR